MDRSGEIKRLLVSSKEEAAAAVCPPPPPDDSQSVAVYYNYGRSGSMVAQPISKSSSESQQKQQQDLKNPSRGNPSELKMELSSDPDSERPTNPSISPHLANSSNVMATSARELPPSPLGASPTAAVC